MSQYSTSKGVWPIMIRSCTMFATAPKYLIMEVHIVVELLLQNAKALEPSIDSLVAGPCHFLNVLIKIADSIGSHAVLLAITVSTICKVELTMFEFVILTFTGIILIRITTQKGPFIQTIHPVWMQIAISYQTPEPLNL